MKPILIFSYVITSLALFVYSYGFVDFNLTLSSHPLVTNFVAWTQSLAMFDRPLSTQVYLALVVVFFLLYLLTINHFNKRQIRKFPWKPIIVIGLILSVAYPFLSSDVFKYLFVGKILVHYQANPYLLPPDQFQGDLWLRFMRWVHTTTPYGPVFSLMAVPYYLLSFGKFTPMLYMFKLDQLAWYLLAIWLVGELAFYLKANQVKKTFAMLVFALNPLILSEWLVNAHNDAIMITLLLLALYLLISRLRLLSWMALLISIGIKYLTVLALPIFLFPAKLSSPGNFRKSIYFLLAAFFLTPLIYHYSWQYQPWYVTWLVPFAAISGSTPVMIIVAAYALGSFLRYIPFISTGLWSATLFQFSLLSFAPVALVLALLCLWPILNKRLREKKQD